MTAITTEDFKSRTGMKNVLAKGSKVIVHNIYRKEAVVEHVEGHTWYRLPRRILAGIPINIKPERG